MNVITNPSPAATGARSVDVRRGANRSEVSTQWFSRGPDERFTSLSALFAATNARKETALQETLEAASLRFIGSEEEPDVLRAELPGDRAFRPTHHAFGQLCSLAGLGRGAEIFRGQPSWLAGLNLSYGLTRLRDAPVKVYGDGATGRLRAATGPDYGRIFDADLVACIRRFAGDGTGDTAWKVPGAIDWSTMRYNPYVDVTTETTTLFASDRDVFIFLCDDTHPIEIGKLPNGDPDLIFRGFYAWNSEVGTRALGIASFWLRAVCQNRNLWGVEDFQELRVVHSKFGADRFVREAAPTLERYANSAPTKLLAGINAAKAAPCASDDAERIKFLTADSLGFSLKQAQHIVATCEREEGRKPETAWDMVQGITAAARSIPHQDTRIEWEKTAARLMDRASRHAIA